MSYACPAQNFTDAHSARRRDNWSSSGWSGCVSLWLRSRAAHKSKEGRPEGFEAPYSSSPPCTLEGRLRTALSKISATSGLAWLHLAASPEIHWRSISSRSGATSDSEGPRIAVALLAAAARAATCFHPDQACCRKRQSATRAAAEKSCSCVDPNGVDVRADHVRFGNIAVLTTPVGPAEHTLKVAPLRRVPQLVEGPGAVQEAPRQRQERPRAMEAKKRSTKVTTLVCAPRLWHPGNCLIPAGRGAICKSSTWGAA